MSAAPSQPVIRPARQDDAGAVGALVAEALSDKYRPALGDDAARAVAGFVRHDLRTRRGSRHWVAEIDGRLAGSVHLALADGWDRGFVRVLVEVVGWPRAIRAALVLSLLGVGALRPDEAYIDELAVDAWARRRGVGRALLAACEQEARQAGRRRLTLWVTIGNAAALPLYEGAGFRERRRRRWILGRLLFRAPGAIFMERELPPR